MLLIISLYDQSRFSYLQQCIFNLTNLLASVFFYLLQKCNASVVVLVRRVNQHLWGAHLFIPILREETINIPLIRQI